MHKYLSRSYSTNCRRRAQLFDVVYREETLLNVIRSVTRNGRSIVLTAVLALILVYMFSIIGYEYFAFVPISYSFSLISLGTSSLRTTFSWKWMAMLPKWPSSPAQSTGSDVMRLRLPACLPVGLEVTRTVAKKEPATRSSCASSPL